MEMLQDGFGRRVAYLRLSVTDRCNYRCFYCMPEQGIKLEPHTHMLRSEEVVRLVRLFVELGVSKVRVTGGEPLVRRNLTGLVGELASLPGLEDLSLTMSRSTRSTPPRSVRSRAAASSTMSSLGSTGRSRWAWPRSS